MVKLDQEEFNDDCAPNEGEEQNKVEDGEPPGSPSAKRRVSGWITLEHFWVCQAGPRMTREDVKNYINTITQLLLCHHLKKACQTGGRIIIMSTLSWLSKPSSACTGTNISANGSEEQLPHRR